MTTWCTPLPDGGRAVARFTERVDGDFAIDGEPGRLAARRRAVVDRPWVWLHQVHGNRVVTVRSVDDLDGVVGSEADAVVTDRADLAVAVQVADCAPIALVSPQGVVAAVHAGWRGAEAGIVARAVAAMRGLGAEQIDGWIGPCIHAECYEFGAADLDRLADRLGPWARATTTLGAPALDLPAVVRHALDGAGVRIGGPSGPDAARCTACTGAADSFSHRARGDRGRHAMVCWIESGGEGTR